MARLTSDQLAGVTLVAALSGREGRRWLRNYGTTRKFRVCPVCDAANTVRGRRLWRMDAVTANAEMLGMPNRVANDIAGAADQGHGPVRRALFAALGLVEDTGLGNVVVIL